MLLHVQGHMPHPGQHIQALTSIAKLIMPERPTIHIAGTYAPGIVSISHEKKSYPYKPVNILIEASAVITHVAIPSIFNTGECCIIIKPLLFMKTYIKNFFLHY